MRCPTDGKRHYVHAHACCEIKYLLPALLSHSCVRAVAAIFTVQHSLYTVDTQLLSVTDKKQTQEFFIFAHVYISRLFFLYATSDLGARVLLATQGF